MWYFLIFLLNILIVTALPIHFKLVSFGQTWCACDLLCPQCCSKQWWKPGKPSHMHGAFTISTVADVGSWTCPDKTLEFPIHTTSSFPGTMMLKQSLNSQEQSCLLSTHGHKTIVTLRLQKTQWCSSTTHWHSGKGCLSGASYLCPLKKW